MANEKNVRVAIIGAGTAGMAAFRAARQHTPDVVLIEGGRYGTTCARVGCMPSKLLIAAADVAHDAREAARFGVHTEVRINGREVMQRVKAERDRFVGFVIESVDKIPEDHHIRGFARFVEPGVIAVGDQRIRARAIVIAAGSSPYIPPMFDAVRDRLVVNDEVFDWDDLPESVAVFGTGIIGLELGQALARLGVRVKLFGKAGKIGPLSDPEVTAAARDAFAGELDIDFKPNVSHVSPHEAGVEIEWQDASGNRHVETFAKLLVGAGRRPNLAQLGIENAGVDLKTPPTIDRYTAQWGSSSIFIAGDASDDAPLLHEAADEGTIAGGNAALYPDVARGHRRSPLAVMFSDPNIAVAGESYAEASQRDIVIGTVSFADQGRSRVMLKNRGLLRVYADAATGCFLGAEMCGPRAEHIAHLLAWSHQQEQTIDGMLRMPFYHPVVEEGLRTALRDASAKLKERKEQKEQKEQRRQ